MSDDYKQAYVAVMSSGAVLLITVMASDVNEGKRKAKHAAVTTDPSGRWDDLSAYPTHDGLEVGVTVLREGDSK